MGQFYLPSFSSFLGQGRKYREAKFSLTKFCPIGPNLVTMKRVLGVWLIIFILWSIYRFLFFFPEWVDELLVKPLVFLGPVFFLLKKEKKSLSSLGIKNDNFFADLKIGVFLGGVFALEGLLANFLKYGRFSFAPILPLKGGGILFYLFLSLATSFSEEVLGRGFLFARLFKIWASLFKAATFSSILFLFLHLPIAFKNLSSWTLFIYLLSVFILGIANSLIFNLRKTLVLPILVHAFWNMTVALYL